MAQENPHGGSRAAALAALHARFAPRLAQRAERGAEPRDPPPLHALKRLSMRAIAKACEQLRTAFHRLDHALPPPVLDELMLSPETRYMRTDPRYLRLLLTRLSRHCSVYLEYSRLNDPGYSDVDLDLDSEEELDRLLQNFADLVLGTAKDSIRTLELGDLADVPDENLCIDPNLSERLREFLHTLLEGLSELHELTVLLWPGVVTDRTLAILARRHPSLTKLCVRGSTGVVTDRGMRGLCSGCPHLSDLHIQRGRSMMTYSALTPFLPTLERLSTDLNLSSEAVYHYAMQQPPPAPLRLDTRLDYHLTYDTLLRHGEVRRVLCTVPNVTDITMSNLNEQSCIGLCESPNNFKKVKLHFEQPVSWGTQRRLMEKLGPTTTSLTMSAGTSSWDLGLVAEHCTELEHLEIEGSIPNVPLGFQVSDGQFCKLVTCEVRHTGASTRLSVPAGLMHQLFCSPRLSTMVLSKVDMPEHVVWRMCEQASQRDRAILSSVKNLSFYNVRGLTTEQVIALMCAAPRLYSMFVERCDLTSEDRALIEGFQRAYLQRVYVDCGCVCWHD